MRYDHAELSRLVGFRRNHQVIPTIEEVEHAYLEAVTGNKVAALRLLDWKRHCFYVKNDGQRQVMALIFAYCDELFPSVTILTVRLFEHSNHL